MAKHRLMHIYDITDLDGNVLLEAVNRKQAMQFCDANFEPHQYAECGYAIKRKYLIRFNENDILNNPDHIEYMEALNRNRISQATFPYELWMDWIETTRRLRCLLQPSNA